MTTLQNTGAAKKRTNRVARLCANAEPVIGALFVHGETTLCHARSILANYLDELPVTRTLRVGDDNTVRW